MWSELLETGILVSVLAATFRIATPILLAALGELVAERSGVYNMGIEGIMLMGAFTGWLATYDSGSANVGFLAAILAGAVMSLLFAFMVITLQIEQIVTGLALNLLGSGLSTYWLRATFSNMNHVPSIEVLGDAPIPLLSGIPFLGPILFDQRIVTYIALLAVPVLWLFLFRSPARPRDPLHRRESQGARHQGSQRCPPAICRGRLRRRHGGAGRGLPYHRRHLAFRSGYGERARLARDRHRYRRRLETRPHPGCSARLFLP